MPETITPRPAGSPHSPEPAPGQVEIPAEAIRAAGEAIEEAAIPRIGRDLGTIHRNDIVLAGLRAAAPILIADERERIRRLLFRAVLQALRCIPDGRIQNGCVIHDGAQVRERLRTAFLAITEPEVPTDA